MTTPLIRDERPEDEAAIRALIRAAFAKARHAAGNEQDIVEALRSAGQLSVSLVAEVDGQIVGHVAVSPVGIEDGSKGWFGLGPIAVEPSLQGRGIGSALMGSSIERLRALGASGCVLLGDPNYYRRFGFSPAGPLVLPGVPAEYFMALALNADAEPARGTVHYPGAFGV